MCFIGAPFPYSTLFGGEAPTAACLAYLHGLVYLPCIPVTGLTDTCCIDFYNCCHTQASCQIGMCCCHTSHSYPTASTAAAAATAVKAANKARRTGNSSNTRAKPKPSSSSSGAKIHQQQQQRGVIDGRNPAGWSSLVVKQ